MKDISLVQQGINYLVGINVMFLLAMDEITHLNSRHFTFELLSIKLVLNLKSLV